MTWTRNKREQIQGDQIAALKAARKSFVSQLDFRNNVRSAFEVSTLDITGKLGKGGFAVVFKGERDGKVYAVKVQKKRKLRASVSGLENALNERTYLIAFQSEFVVECFGTWRSANYVAIVLEYSPYSDLQRYWRLHRHKSGMPQDLVLHTGAQIVCGLEYLHANNIIHGDLKPDNCLLFEKGRLKLSDFGLSRYGLEHPHRRAGTLYFMAPEMFDPACNYTQMVDWWALGVLMHQLLLNKFPFIEGKKGEEARAELRKLVDLSDPLDLPLVDSSNLDPDAKNFVRDLLVKDRDKRLGGPGGSQQVMDHRYFRRDKGFDFVHVKHKDYICPNFKADCIAAKELKKTPKFAEDHPREADIRDMADFADY